MRFYISSIGHLAPPVLFNQLNGEIEVKRQVWVENTGRRGEGTWSQLRVSEGPRDHWSPKGQGLFWKEDIHYFVAKLSQSFQKVSMVLESFQQMSAYFQRAFNKSQPAFGELSHKVRLRVTCLGWGGVGGVEVGCVCVCVWGGGADSCPTFGTNSWI